MMITHYITWWNVENLFDVYNSTQRPEWLAKELKSELEGWTQVVLDKKINNLASVIKQMNDNQGPDMLGICEVENKNVVQKLVDNLTGLGRNYQIVHHDTTDNRGIDIAFIFDANKYQVDRDKIFSYVVLKRFATRDILQVNFTTLKGTEIIVIGNHWPSRSEGQYESEPYRMMAGEILSYWMKRIQEIKGANVPVLVMGDFNDTPYNRALTEYALSTISINKVVYGRNPYLFNLMWPLLGSRKASYVFDSEPLMLDQFLVSKGIVLKGGKFKIDDAAVKIEIFEGMIKGRDNTPVRFDRPSSKKNYSPHGFSDHLPISVKLIEK